MARLVLGVTGGIAAYKSVALLRLAVKAGHAVRVIQTPNSLEFVGAKTFEAISGAPVLVSEFEADPFAGRFPGEAASGFQGISHLKLVEDADAFIIAPATASSIANLAIGRAENLLGAAYLAARCPVLLAPAMNHNMWHHPATQRNVDTLERDGVLVISPSSGSLASHGEEGDGRMAEPEELMAAIESAISV